MGYSFKYFYRILIYRFIMYCCDFHVVMQEVPGEISLCFSISGCPLRCEGCHSPFLWKEKYGTPLTFSAYRDILYRYSGFASCVLFMGGEWHPKTLLKFLKYARRNGYKTCLYTGLDAVDPALQAQLTWIKTGRWVASLGGLDAKGTNQRFTHVETGETLNHLFHKTTAT